MFVRSDVDVGFEYTISEFYLYQYTYTAVSRLNISLNQNMLIGATKPAQLYSKDFFLYVNLIMYVVSRTHKHTPNPSVHF